MRAQVKAHRVEDLYGTFMFHVGVDGNMLIVDMRPETLKPWGYSPGQKVLVGGNSRSIQPLCTFPEYLRYISYPL